MENIKKYTEAFVQAFDVDESVVTSLEYESIQEWDSVGHMVLIAELEDAFDIMMEMEDIIDFSGFEKGKELLKNYGVVV
jgi:acyl carrier protein